MWIFLNDAFLSIVEHVERPDDLLVRGRVSGDIERTFTDAEVIETKAADYRYRAVIPRRVVADVIAERIVAIDYPNFKNSIASVDHVRRHACGDVWGVMRRLQEDAPQDP